jgi:hypothetical protein
MEERRRKREGIMRVTSKEKKSSSLRGVPL